MLAATGAAEADLVGHSQGGMMPRYYLKYLGGAAKVHTLVGLSPSNHGTTLDGLFVLSNFFPGANQFTGVLCPACEQQRAGSAFITNLNSRRRDRAGVDYTVIQTRFDQVVTPYTSAFLSGSNVKNILLQNQCVLDLGDHLSMPYDHIAAADVLTALDPAHPRKPALHADPADRRRLTARPRLRRRRPPRGRDPASAGPCRRGRRGAGSSAAPSPAAG